MSDYNNEQLILSLDKQKTIRQINADIDRLQGQLKQVKATGALDTSSTVKQLNAQIASLQSKLNSVSLSVKADPRSAQKSGTDLGNTILGSAKKAIDSSFSELGTRIGNKIKDQVTSKNAGKLRISVRISETFIC